MQKSTWLVAGLVLVLITMAIAGIVQYRSYDAAPGQSTLRNQPGESETWGSGVRKEGQEGSLPPNARPETPSGAPGSGNAPTGQGGPATNDR